MARRRRKPPEEAPVSFFSFQDIICCVTGILVLITMLLALDLVNRSGQAGANKNTGPMAELHAAIEKERERQKALRDSLSRVKSTIASAAEDASVVPQDIPRLEDEAKIAALEAEKARNRLREKEALRDQLLIELEGLKESSKSDAERLAEMRKKILVEKERVDVPAAGGTQSPTAALYVEFSPSDVRVGQLSAAGQPLLIQKLAGYNAFLQWASRRNRTDEFFVLLVKPETSSDFPKLRFDLRRLGFQVGWDAITSDASFVTMGARDKKKEAR